MDVVQWTKDSDEDNSIDRAWDLIVKHHYVLLMCICVSSCTTLAPLVSTTRESQMNINEWESYDGVYRRSCHFSCSCWQEPEWNKSGLQNKHKVIYTCHLNYFYSEIFIYQLLIMYTWGVRFLTGLDASLLLLKHGYMSEIQLSEEADREPVKKNKWGINVIIQNIVCFFSVDSVWDNRNEGSGVTWDSHLLICTVRGPCHHFQTCLTDSVCVDLIYFTISKLHNYGSSFQTSPLIVKLVHPSF